MKDIEIQKILDDFNNSPISKYYEEKGEGVASANANRKAYGQTESFKKRAREMAKVGGKIGGVTKKNNGFDYRKISLIGAEVMKNMPTEKRLEYAERARKIHTGRKISDEVRKKFSEKRKGKPSPMKGKTFSEQAKKNMSEGSKGKKHSEETKNKIRQRMLTNNPFKGKKHSKESLIKIKENHPSKVKKICEHCKKEFDLPNYNRYHGEKCFKVTGVSTVTEEQKQKIRDKLLGKTSGKSVICYSYPDMHHIGEYDNLTTATNELKLNRECARLTCVGKRNHVNGFTFKYKD